MNNMRTRKIIIYPLIMAFLVPLTVSATETVGTEAETGGEVIQEEYNESENVGGNQPETGNVSDPDSGSSAETESEPVAETPPETIPEGEVITEPEEGTIMESASSEAESENLVETETQTESEMVTEKPLLDEEVTGLLKEYLTGAVSGNDAPAETSAEPINTEYQDYVKEVLKVLQDNSTSQISLSIVIMVALGILAGCFVAFMVMRRFL